MLSNAYLLAKFRFDTAENERNFAENFAKTGNYPTDPLPEDGPDGGARARGRVELQDRRPRDGHFARGRGAPPSTSPSRCPP